jgi:hypothetical protein
MSPEMTASPRGVKDSLVALIQRAESAEETPDQLIEVTLLVGGALVRGGIIPYARFATWFNGLRQSRSGWSQDEVPPLVARDINEFSAAYLERPI